MQARLSLSLAKQNLEKLVRTREVELDVARGEVESERNHLTILEAYLPSSYRKHDHLPVNTLRILYRVKSLAEVVVKWMMGNDRWSCRIREAMVTLIMLVDRLRVHTETCDDATFLKLSHGELPVLEAVLLNVVAFMKDGVLGGEDEVEGLLKLSYIVYNFSHNKKTFPFLTRYLYQRSLFYKTYPTIGAHGPTAFA